MTLIRKYIWTIAGTALGVAAGYAYYSYAGCPGGTCMITASPVNSMLYGAFMGGLLGSMFPVKTQKKNEHE